MEFSIGDTRDPQPAVSGAKYRNGYKASVIGILGRDAPRVSSKGILFYNHDHWSARFLIGAMCEWAKGNPGCAPTADNIQEWVTKANAGKVSQAAREIVIANTPDVLPVRTHMALVGGAYHEAFHTLYSARRALALQEVLDIVLPRWAKVKDWSHFVVALLQWGNIIEDIRIERLGNKEYDTIHVKMCDLQDFILLMEEKNDAEVFVKTGEKLSAISIVERTFRDLGLSYHTEYQRMAVDRYRKDNNEAVELVLSGPIAPYLKETIELGEKDDLACVRLAMDVIAKLAELGGADEQDSKSKKGQSGDGVKKCPSCGAPAGNLIVRPKADGNGGKVPGKGIVTCTVCGHQEEVDVEKRPKEQGQKEKGQKGQDGPKFEGFDKDSGAGGESKTGDGKKDAEAGSGKPDDPKKDDGSGAGKDPKKEPGTGTGEKETGTAQAGQNPQDGLPEEGETDDVPTPENQQTDEPGLGCGGFKEGNIDYEGYDWSHLAESIAQQGNADTGLLDSGSALEQGIQTAQTKEDADTEKGEQPWAPYDTSIDIVNVIKPSAKGLAYDTLGADEIIKSVKHQIAYLRSRLRTVVRSLEQTRTVHGVQHGRRLSSRFLVDSKVALMGYDKPTRAYCQKGDQIDLTMSAAVVLDESGSMASYKETATRITVALTEPLDGLGSPVLVLGFRNGKACSRQKPEDTGTYHRNDGVIYDIFKGWNEKFHAIRWRFAHTRGDGGTPMSDGIQFAMMGLSVRKEAHRFLFVVTDGGADYNHRPVIARQIRLCKEAGIHLIGVGIGSGASYVKTLFPDHVWSNTVEEFPKLLLAKINELVDVRAGKRGMRVKK